MQDETDEAAMDPMGLLGSEAAATHPAVAVLLTLQLGLLAYVVVMMMRCASAVRRSISANHLVPMSLVVAFSCVAGSVHGTLTPDTENSEGTSTLIISLIVLATIASALQARAFRTTLRSGTAHGDGPIPPGL